RHRVGAFSVKEYHGQPGGMLLLVRARERHPRPVRQHRFVGRRDRGAGAGPRVRGHDANVADLPHETGVGSEILRRFVGAAKDEHRKKKTWRKSVEQKCVEERRSPFTSLLHAVPPRLSCLTTHGFSSRTNLPLSTSNTLMRTTTPARRSSTILTCTTLRSVVSRYRIQLPAGASASIPAQERDFGRGGGPGGTPGIQVRHCPGFGRCPGGTPSVAAVLGPPSERASGTTNTVRVVRVHPVATARPSAVMATGSDR